MLVALWLLLNVLTRDLVSGEWTCKYCPKANKNKARISLSRHAETHFPGFSQQCPYCEKVVGSRHLLRAHVSRAHTAAQSNQHYECVLGVPVPYKRDRSLITWDRSQNIGCFGTGPIILFWSEWSACAALGCWHKRRWPL